MSSRSVYHSLLMLLLLTSIAGCGQNSRNDLNRPAVIQNSDREEESQLIKVIKCLKETQRAPINKVETIHHLAAIAESIAPAAQKCNAKLDDIKQYAKELIQMEQQ